MSQTSSNEAIEIVHTKTATNQSLKEDEEMGSEQAEIELEPLTGAGGNRSSNPTHHDDSSQLWQTPKRGVGSRPFVSYAGIVLFLLVASVVVVASSAGWLAAPGEPIAMTTTDKGMEAASGKDSATVPPQSDDSDLRSYNDEKTTTKAHQDEPDEVVVGQYIAPDKKLRLLATHGCSGSSFVYTTIDNILEKHGFHMLHNHKDELGKLHQCGCKERGSGEDHCDWGRSEIYKPHKNCMYQDAKALAPPETPDSEIMINATVMLDEFGYQNDFNTLYKWELLHIDNLVSQVEPENVLFGVVIRSNPVDYLICSVRDCFEKGQQVGTPVAFNETTNSWEEYDGCFKRRKEGVKSKAHFYEEEFDLMINTLKIIESDIEDTKKKYEGTVTYEELTAFEYTDDEETFQKSMNAWHSLANRFVADGNNAVDYDTIESELGGMRNTRSISYQEDSVHNYEAFFQAIRDAGLGKHIRTQTQF